MFPMELLQNTFKNIDTVSTLPQGMIGLVYKFRGKKLFKRKITNIASQPIPEITIEKIKNNNENYFFVEKGP